MRLLIVRHAEAVPAAAAGVPDAERPLTRYGEYVFRAAARELARRVPAPEVLLASPLLRAQQTAAFLSEAWGVAVTAEPALASGSVETILEALTDHANRDTVAIVGHEPTVSGLLGELVGGDVRGFSPGAAALVETSAVSAHDGRLLWFLPAEAPPSSP